MIAEYAHEGGKKSRFSLPAALALLLICLCLAACKVEVYGGLSEDQANLMLGTLLKRGIDVVKEDKGKNGFTIMVEENQLVQALDILQENSLPQEKYKNIGEVFSGQGMISSPSEEDARMAYAIAQELSETFSRIDGVLTARVHVVMGKVDEAVNLRIAPSVGVFIRHNPDSAVVNMVSKIREISARSVPGLTTDNVSVMLVPVRETVTVPPPVTITWQERYLLPILLGMALLGAGAGIAIFRAVQKRKAQNTPEA